MERHMVAEMETIEERTCDIATDDFESLFLFCVNHTC